MTDREIARVFGLNLKRFLSVYGLKQNELAKKLGVGTSTVNNWVQGQKLPRMSKVDAMCDIFGCSRSDFLDESADILAPNERELIRSFRLMNAEGKTLLVEYADFLLGKYAK